MPRVVISQTRKVDGIGVERHACIMVYERTPRKAINHLRARKSRFPPIAYLPTYMCCRGGEPQRWGRATFEAAGGMQPAKQRSCKTEGARSGKPITAVSAAKTNKGRTSAAFVLPPRPSEGIKSPLKIPSTRA
jgi:hypothetical protein